MTVQIPAPIPLEEEASLLNRAQQGDQAAFTSLVEPWRAPLFGYIYRMTTQRQDAEDLLQDVLVRVLESLPQFRREARFKSWLFGIATHVCLDHLRRKKRWRVEAQMIGEREARETPGAGEVLRALVAKPEFRFEIREHIAFCFACIARTLPPVEQAALLLREMLEFTAEESAAILNISEPAFRHRLAAARAAMTQAYEGLCQLINKTGACWQCRGLRELAPEQNRGSDLVQIEVAPGLAVTAENLLDARLRIGREADLENGRTRTMHDLFYQSLANREESRP
ncbi:MAG: RNA polymerase sigma factor [Candidatus Acidiferrales bacterium]